MDVPERPGEGQEPHRPAAYAGGNRLLAAKGVVAVTVHLHELGPVGGWAARGRYRRRFERFAKVREDLPDQPRLGDE